MKLTKAALLGAIALGAVGTVSVMLMPAQENQADTAQMLQTQVFAIDNMTCALCPITVRKAMEGVIGVQSAQADFENKTAQVRFDPAKTTIAAIAAASANAGYPAHAIANRPQ